jgi:hypothetical protein
MAWLLEQAVMNGKEGREFWWGAPVSSVTTIVFKRFKPNIDPFFIRKIIQARGDKHKQCGRWLNSRLLTAKLLEAGSLRRRTAWAPIATDRLWSQTLSAGVLIRFS